MRCTCACLNLYDSRKSENEDGVASLVLIVVRIQYHKLQQQKVRLAHAEAHADFDFDLDRGALDCQYAVGDRKTDTADICDNHKKLGKRFQIQAMATRA